MIPTLARKIWKVTRLVWLGLFLAFIVNYTANVAPTPAHDFAHGFSTSVLGWFFLPGLHRTLTLSILSTFAGLTLYTMLITMREEQKNQSKALRSYLQMIIHTYQRIDVLGIYQQAQPLIPVSVPLNEVFVHLFAVEDRPFHDLLDTPPDLLEALRQSSTHNIEEHQQRLQALRIRRYSHLGQQIAESHQKEDVEIENVDNPDDNPLRSTRPTPPPQIDIINIVQSLNEAAPAAVLLGGPGSGKSTLLCWLAMQMAHASLSRFSLFSRRPSLSRFSLFSRRLSPKQIPVLIHISEYARWISTHSEHSFEQFFRERYAILESPLEQGRCLLLFDGLDEIADDSTRREAVRSIAHFILEVASKSRMKAFNRFIVTSRVVGYKDTASSLFARYPHYTLSDLNDEEIKDFLQRWCPAVERSVQYGAKHLTWQQATEVSTRGYEQYDQLCHALQDNLGVKRLASNPLMLTILALIQRSGQPLPHRRIDLYRIATHTLLETWNQETQRKSFRPVEIPLVELLLGNVAYHFHTTGDPFLTVDALKTIAQPVIHDFYAQPLDDDALTIFIETLRSSSGILVEIGTHLFKFLHRTFQEYYVARYLLETKHYPQETLKHFMIEHHRSAVWREPLLLTIADKSVQSRQEASHLIEAILACEKGYDSILKQSLFFAANSVLGCEAWSVNRTLQHRIATQLFQIYGDSFGAGRYTQLQREIEKTALLWLSGQPDTDTFQETLPPLLDIWHIALCDSTNSLRQKGAVTLLRSYVFSRLPMFLPIPRVLIPPLMRLAKMEDWPAPTEIGKQMKSTVAQPCSEEVERAAANIFASYDRDGPARWLHSAWLTWSRVQPTLLTRLTQHSLELNTLLTPVNSFSWAGGYERDQKRRRIANQWRRYGRRNAYALQLQLLQTCTAAHNPYAYLFWKLLTEEERTPRRGTHWKNVWVKCLQEEMAHGRTATYQSCMQIRFLLCRRDKQVQKALAREISLMLSVKNSSEVRELTLALIAKMFLLDLKEDGTVQYGGPVCQVQKSVVGKIPLSPFQ